MYLLSASHGQGTSVSPSSSGAPTECRHGTQSPSPSTSSAAWPMRVMIRMRRRDVGGVGELHADVGDRRTERPHRERHDVHRAALHGTRVELLHLDAHLGGVAPVVVRAGVVLGGGADERAVLDAGDVGRVGVRPVAVRVAWPRRASVNVPAVDELLAQLLVLVGGTVAPVRRRSGCMIAAHSSTQSLSRWLPVVPLIWSCTPSRG